MQKQNCCIVCSTPLKIKGYIVSCLLVCSAIATSILTFTTNCKQVIHFANNQTQTINDVGVANKAVSLSLLGFAIVSGLFERYINLKVVELEAENENLSVELAITKAQTVQTNRSNIESEDNEPYNTGKSEISVYPPPIIFSNV